MKFLLKHCNRLSQKFIAGIVLILMLTLAGTLFANSQIVERYYLRSQREYVRQIGAQLEAKLQMGMAPQEAVEEIEKREKVLIAYVSQEKEPDLLANELRETFKEKGLGFQKFWMWDQDYATAIQKGSQFRLYSQDKMNYSILVEYLPLSSGLYAIAAIIPDAGAFIAIINHIGFFIYSFSILIAIVLIFILIKHITNPLKEVKEFTKRISTHQYELLHIKTGDELEDVANSLNEMARDVETYQKMLEVKNDQMKQLLSDVAHDLKTPISLVGVYAAGIKDGLDDGTFLDTIISQNNKMFQIVESLLHLSRIEQKKYAMGEVKLDQLLLQSISDQKIFFQQRNLELHPDIETNLNIDGNAELISELFSNLLSNAAKYAAFGTVTVELYQKEEYYIFHISNNTENTDLDTEYIWQPFYVGEHSRNKGLSGTGLGLPIVKKIAEQFHYSVSCILEGQQILFEVIFPKKKF